MGRKEGLKLWLLNLFLSLINQYLQFLVFKTEQTTDRQFKLNFSHSDIGILQRRRRRIKKKQDTGTQHRINISDELVHQDIIGPDIIIVFSKFFFYFFFFLRAETLENGNGSESAV